MNVKAILVKMLGNLGEYLSVLFNKAIHDELAIILPLATKAVVQVAKDATLTSGEAKFDGAVAIILAEIGKSQLQIGVSLVNFAVELAYQKFKATE